MQTRKINPFFFCPLSFVFCLLFFVLLLFSCKKSTEPIYNPQNLQLKVLDVSCTEAWLSLSAGSGGDAKNDYLNKTLKLYRNDSLKLEKPLTAEDSLLYVDGLWPNTRYAFKAAVYDGNKLLAQSAAVSAATMDTTSHNFTWQTYEFGGQNGSSYFNDVAIIDENDIWAVGEINTRDGKFNAAHWNGEKWELKKITYGGWFWTINTVFAFSHNDVWFEAFVKWNGNRFIEFPVPSVLTGYGLNKIWGTSDQDLYVVGNNGLIAHYDGHQWQRIESWTKLKIYNILGKRNDNTGEHEILAVASNKLEGYDRAIMGIRKNQTFMLSNKNIPSTLTGIWFLPGHGYWVVGSGMYFKKNIYDSTAWKRLHDGITPYYTNAIMGNNVNDIYVVGSYGEFLHFNGVDWQSKIKETGFDGDLRSLDVNGNLVCAVGEILDSGKVKAIILKAKNL